MHEAVARFLVESKADINLATNDGATPLNVDCEKGHEAVARLLLDNKADINLADNDGATPM